MLFIIAARKKPEKAEEHTKMRTGYQIIETGF